VGQSHVSSTADPPFLRATRLDPLLLVLLLAFPLALLEVVVVVLVLALALIVDRGRARIIGPIEEEAERSS